ncbi:FlgO family outer membrane protein [Arcobacter sp. CECT 8986]|uniref:FlgO family outer membrane protein n=1 Tax=Arcobacter sp. CECT 8986 TaxID=2044507 RepID=UPI0013E99A84|nr:FlgO family outer membrane protein [Arcobacter sp. CECT 8986]
MLKSFIKTCLSVSAVALLATGCTAINNNNTTTPSLNTNAQFDPSVQKENKKVQVTKEFLKVAQDKQYHVTTQNSLEGTIDSLATQMMRNTKVPSNRPVLFTSFVRLDNLKKTTEFGRVISESLINELSNRGFNVIEFRGQLNVSIDDKGEYFISRDIGKLKDKIPNTYVVVGTYSRQYGKVVLNARVIDNISGRIISSSRAIYQHNKRNDCVIFKDCKPPRTISIVKETK